VPTPFAKLGAMYSELFTGLALKSSVKGIIIAALPSP